MGHRLITTAAYNEETPTTETLPDKGTLPAPGAAQHLCGRHLSFQLLAGSKFKPLGESYLYGQKTHYTATGVGAILEYDSRDFIPNPFRGVYVGLQETLFPQGLGNCGRSLWRTTFTTDYYRQLWKGSILAADLYAGSTPRNRG